MKWLIINWNEMLHGLWTVLISKRIDRLLEDIENDVHCSLFFHVKRSGQISVKRISVCKIEIEIWSADKQMHEINYSYKLILRCCVDNFTSGVEISEKILQWNVKILYLLRFSSRNRILRVFERDLFSFFKHNTKYNMKFNRICKV